MLLVPTIATLLGSACKLLSSYQLDFCKTSPRFSEETAVRCPGDTAGSSLAAWTWTRQCFKMLLKLDADPSPQSGWIAETLRLIRAPRGWRLGARQGTGSLVWWGEPYQLWVLGCTASDGLQLPGAIYGQQAPCTSHTIIIKSLLAGPAGLQLARLCRAVPGAGCDVLSLPVRRWGGICSSSAEREGEREKRIKQRRIGVVRWVVIDTSQVHAHTKSFQLGEKKI